MRGIKTDFGSKYFNYCKRLLILQANLDMLQNHAGQTPILIGIPYPVVYEIPARRYYRKSVGGHQQSPDYQDYVENTDTFEGPAWMMN